MSKKKYLLQSTTDYSIFELCQFNREVAKTKFLRESMKKHGFIPANPIHCTKLPNGRLQIKAGHHRLEVAQELGLPVYYVISDDEATVHELEKATVRWTQKDFLNSFVKCGLEDYMKVREFHERTGITLGCCVSILAGETASSGGNQLERFKTGQYKTTKKGIEHTENLADITKELRSIGVRIDSILIQSLSRCLFVDEFSIETFKQRARVNVSMFKPCRSIVEQTDLLETIYNWKAFAANRVPLAFLTNKAMAKRSAVPKSLFS